MKRLFLIPAVFLGFFSSSTAQVTVSDTFVYTGGMQTFTITNCMSNITIKATGAQGANAADRLPSNASGGLGGYAEGVYAGTAGQVLNIFVGGAGSDTGAGGYNGGGSGGTSVAGSGCFGGLAGGGGGASDVRVGGTALSDRIIVAAGGGGAGRDYCNGTCQPCGCGGAGGGAGGAVGQNGLAANDCGFAYAGTNTNFGGGATASSGGTAGPSDGGGANVGTMGVLGVGGTGAPGNYDVAGGGGGGGYYGGGGGGGASNGSGVGGGGGGGGSSFTGTLSNPTTVTGVGIGNGMVIITYVLTSPTTVTFDLASNTSCVSDTVILPSGSPSGGSYSGNGVTGSTFDAAAAGSGQHVITYSYTDINGCTSSDADTIMVYDLPSVSLGLSNTMVCSYETAVALDGESPTGGTFSGNGVVGTSFDATAGNLGNNVISYQFTDAQGCTNTASDTVVVVAPTALTVMASADSVCSTVNSVALTGMPSGGNFSGTGVTGSNFDASVAGIGVHTVSYDYVDSNSCASNATYDIAVIDCASLIELGEDRGVVIFPNPMENQASFVLSGSPISEGSFQLTDMQGKVVSTNSFTGNTAVLNRKGLNAGTYFLTIFEGQKEILRAKLVVK